jgi:exonuclease III
MAVKGKDISICVWNVNGIISKYQNKFDKPDFIEAINRHDIIGLVETHLSGTDDISLDGYSMFRKDRPKYKSAKRSFGGIAVFIKDSIRKGARHIECKNENYHWIRLKSDFFSFEKDVYMCVCHIPPHNSTYTARTGDTVLDEISNDVSKYSQIGDVVICGDLNARTGKKLDYIIGDDDTHLPSHIPYDVDSKMFPRESQDSHISQRGNTLLDICIEMKLRFLNGRCAGDICGKFTCHNSLGSSVVDYVIVSEPLVTDVMYFHVHDYDATYSDHCKLTFKLRSSLNEQRGENESQTINLTALVNRYKWNNNSKDILSKAFESNHVLSKINNLMVDLDKSDIPSDEYAESLQDIYHTAAKIAALAKSHSKPTKRKQRKQPWYDKDLNILKQRIKAGSRQLQMHPYDPIIRGLFYRDLKHYNKQRKLKMKKYRQEILSKLEQLEQKSPTEFWKLIDLLKNNEQSSKVAHSNKIDPQEWYDYFKKLNTVPPDLKEKELKFSQLNKVCESTPTFNELCYKIEMHEIRAACNTLRNNKAAGVDGLISEIIKASISKMLPSLTKLFNKILTTSTYPASWLTGCITPIYKADNPLDPSNYRGITVNSCLGKIFNIVLNNRLDAFLTEHQLINDVQIGFTKKARTSDHMFLLKTLINKYTGAGKRLYACFIDFKKAYDMVLHQCLFNKLLKLGIGGMFYKLIKDMLAKSTLCVKLGSAITPLFKSHIGVGQGDPLSANLFKVFMNDIPTIFQSDCTPAQVGDRKINCLLYADDAILISETDAGLQKCLDYLESHCEDIGMSINPAKSKVMIFNKSGKLFAHTFHIGGTQLETVKRYKYLGILFSLSGTFSFAKDQIYRKSLKSHFKLCKMIQDLNNPKLAMHLFDHTITPLLTYGSEIWGQFNPFINGIEEKSLEGLYANSKIEYTQRKFARYLLGLPRNCSKDALLGELGWKPIYSQICVSVIKFWHRVANAPRGTLLYDIYLENLNLKDREQENIIDVVLILLQKLGIGETLEYIKNMSLSHLTMLLKSNVQSTIEKEWQFNISKTTGKQKSHNNKLRTYATIKSHFKLEPYLLAVKNRAHRISLCRFRTSNHSLRVEKGRYQSLKLTERTCCYCTLNVVEDEYHFLLKCPLYSTERAVYLKNVFDKNLNIRSLQPDMLFLWLLSTEDKDVCSETARFIYESLAKRKSQNEI